MSTPLAAAARIQAPTSAQGVLPKRVRSELVPLQQHTQHEDEENVSFKIERVKAPCVSSEELRGPKLFDGMKGVEQNEDCFVT